MLEPSRVARFCARFAKQLANLSLLSTPGEASDAVGDAAEGEPQRIQREHFDWWAENEKQSYAAYQSTPFWMAADAAAFRGWQRRIKPDSWALDLGCADGRSSFQFVRLVGQVTVVGFDVSRVMVSKAIERARSAGVMGRTAFFVADAHAPPLQDLSFDYVLTYGVLHHFPDPARTCREIQRLLKEGGTHFGSENNKSLLRGIFDLLMRLRPLWIEEAGKEPLISKEMIRAWVKGFPVGVQYKTSVFLPPHLFNLVGPRIAKPLLAHTDRLFSALPGLRNHGGLLVFEITKRLLSPDAPRPTGDIAHTP